MKLENLKCIGGENDILREGSFRSEIKGCKFFARQYGSPIESDSTIQELEQMVEG